MTKSNSPKDGKRDHWKPISDKWIPSTPSFKWRYWLPSPGSFCARHRISSSLRLSTIILLNCSHCLTTLEIVKYFQKMIPGMLVIEQDWVSIIHFFNHSEKAPDQPNYLGLEPEIWHHIRKIEDMNESYLLSYWRSHFTIKCKFEN